MKLLIVFVCLLIKEGFSQAHLQSSCDLPSVQECLKPINFSQLNNPITDAQMTQFCDNVSAAKICFEQKSIDCTVFDIADISGQYEAAVYACGDGRNGFKGMQACFSNPNYVTSLSSCKTALSKVNSTLDYNIVGSNCKYQNGLYSCLVNASKVCNSDGFVTSFYKKSIEKSLGLNGCKLDTINWETRAYSECNTFKFKQCTQKVNISQQFYIDFLSLSEIELNNYCGTVKNAQSCVTKDAKCNQSISSVVEQVSLSKGVFYLCETDRSGFNDAKKCISNYGLAAIQFLKTFQSCLTNKFDCESQNTAHKCLVNVMETKCGNATTVQNLYSIITQPLLDFVGCKLNLTVIGITEDSANNDGNGDPQVTSGNEDLPVTRNNGGDNTIGQNIFAYLLCMILVLRRLI